MRSSGAAQAFDERGTGVDVPYDVRHETPALVMLRELVGELVDRSDQGVRRTDDLRAVRAGNVARDQCRGLHPVLGDLDVLHERVEDRSPRVRRGAAYVTDAPVDRLVAPVGLVPMAVFQR